MIRQAVAGGAAGDGLGRGLHHAVQQAHAARTRAAIQAWSWPVAAEKTSIAIFPTSSGRLATLMRPALPAGTCGGRYSIAMFSASACARWTRRGQRLRALNPAWAAGLRELAAAPSGNCAGNAVDAPSASAPRRGRRSAPPAGAHGRNHQRQRAGVLDRLLGAQRLGIRCRRPPAAPARRRCRHLRHGLQQAGAEAGVVGAQGAGGVAPVAIDQQLEAALCTEL